MAVGSVTVNLKTSKSSSLLRIPWVGVSSSMSVAVSMVSP